MKNQPYIIAFAGKGGVGKTTLAALLLDEIARSGYTKPVLAVDGDPASTLHLALGFPHPLLTVADVRDRNRLPSRVVRDLPEGVTPQDLVGASVAKSVLTRHKLRDMDVDFLAMGGHEDQGCYCSVNRALGQALEALLGNYALIVIDNEAGIEHLNRYRIKRVDCFLAVANHSPASRKVALDILDMAHRTKIVSGRSEFVLNRAPAGNGYQHDISPVIPAHPELQRLEANNVPVVRLSDDHSVRLAVQKELAALMPTRVRR